LGEVFFGRLFDFFCCVEDDVGVLLVVVRVKGIMALVLERRDVVEVDEERRPRRRFPEIPATDSSLENTPVNIQ
jgi:hypothetical protein